MRVRTMIVRGFGAGLMLVAPACSLLAETDDLTGNIDASADPRASDASSDDAPYDASDVADAPSDVASSVETSTPDTSTAYRNAIAADSPVAHFRLDETAGTACASEASNASHTCTYAGNITFGRPGIAGGRSVRLDDAQAKISIGAPTYDFTKPFTIEMWIAVDTILPTQPLADVSVFQPARSGIYMFTFDASQLRTEIWFNGAFVGYTLAASALSAQTWHHVAIGYAPPNDFTYVDGVLSATAGDYDAGGRPNVSTPFVIGGWVGTVDEIAFYDKALAANRVLAHYALR